MGGRCVCAHVSPGGWRRWCSKWLKPSVSVLQHSQDLAEAEARLQAQSAQLKAAQAAATAAAERLAASESAAAALQAELAGVQRELSAVQQAAAADMQAARDSYCAELVRALPVALVEWLDGPRHEAAACCFGSPCAAHSFSDRPRPTALQDAAEAEHGEQLADLQQQNALLQGQVRVAAVPQLCHSCTQLLRLLWLPCMPMPHLRLACMPLACQRPPTCCNCHCAAQIDALQRQLDDAHQQSQQADGHMARLQAELQEAQVGD